VNFSLLCASYCAVLGAELLGDKTLYVTSILSLRSKLPPIICGFAAAVSAKMFVAIWIGSFIMKLPREALAIVSATTFFLMAFSLWCRKTHRASHVAAPEFWPRAMLVPFATLFFTEWGDLGQITAATLSASCHQPFTIWLGAMLALTTKCAVGILVGLRFRKQFSQRLLLRPIAACTCATLGVMALLRIEA